MMCKFDVVGNLLSDSVSEWFCVCDEVIGLVWEVKSVDMILFNYKECLFVFEIFGCFSFYVEDVEEVICYSVGDEVCMMV